MVKRYVILILSSVFSIYTTIVYTVGTEVKGTISVTGNESRGKLLFQKYNCISCHQIYGLGGYIGPELTTITKNNLRLPFSKAILKTGSLRMPNFKLSDHEIECIICYLKYIESTASTYKTKASNNL